MVRFLLPLNRSAALLAVLLISAICRSQTDQDGIMMNKNQFYNGFMYSYSSWEKYWEGKLNRTNENLGTVSTQSIMYMANYGIKDNLNIMVGAPYVWTKATAGTLAGMKGIQDLSLFLKWRAVEQKSGKNKLSLFVVGGISTPLSDYVIDFLPLSVGLGSTNGIIRGTIDYEYGNLFATGSAAYIYRSNVKIDRTSYYDTELHLTNEVEMPNVSTLLLRAGYRSKYFAAEAMVSNMNTLGGFDMTRNNMPFPSNEMDATMVGAGVKYTWKKHTGVSLVANYNYVVAGEM